MGDGTKESPLTREDALRLRKENGGTAKGLDLSGKTFESGIKLGKLNLNGIVLRDATLVDAHLEGAKLRNAHLERAMLTDAHLGKAHLLSAHFEGATLYDAHLEEATLEVAHLEGANLAIAHLEGAWLRGAHFEKADLLSAHLEEAILADAHLEGARLWGAHLERADLRYAHLEGAKLWSVHFSPDTKLENADWGNHILGEEKEGRFDEATDIYRHLKQWHTTAGIYDTAGEFYYREMEARRKALKHWPPSRHSIRHTLYWLLCGYSERPWKVFVSAAAVILVLAFIYFAIGTLTPNTFLNSLYYSAVSFTALGYGKWAPEPTGLVKGLGAAEAFAGVFMMALFLITFTRKMTR